MSEMSMCSGPGTTEGRERERRAREEALQLAPLLSLPVLRFALAMQERLDANAHKPGWRDDTPEALLRRLHEETAELNRALGGDASYPSIRREAADVGNFAMMLADNFGDLDTFDAESEIGAALARTEGAADRSPPRGAPLPMTPERAREITAACVRNAMSRNIPGQPYVPLPAVSLEELLLANRLMQEDKSYNGMMVDPRGLAAAYAFEQYRRSPEALLNAVGLTLADDEEEDEG